MSDRLSQIKARLAAATPGPWTISKPGISVKAANGYYIAEYSHGDPGAENDAAFVANAPTDIAFLLAEIDLARSAETLLRAELQRQRDINAQLQTEADNWRNACNSDSAKMFSAMAERDDARAKLATAVVRRARR